MQTSPTGSGLDLALDLPRGAGRRAALERALREAIRTGRLRDGTTLPSSRALAADLGVARGTVTAVYEQLVSDGWLVARRGSSTAVARSPGLADEAPPSNHRNRPLHDFHPGLPALDSFPRRAWTHAVRRALANRPESAIFCKDPQGDVELRIRLVEHLGRARGILASPDDVIVCSGFTQAFLLWATALRQRGARTVAVEDPCHARYRAALATAGLEVIPVPVDEHGLQVDLVPSHVDCIFVSPAHVDPLGAVLSAERRRRLVAHAEREGALIFEDDYVGDFHYDGASPMAVQHLAPDHVVYAGDVSPSLAPGLWLAWLVAPRALRSELVATKEVVDNGPSGLEQLALGELLASGAFARHVRRQRARYKARREQLVSVLTRRVPSVRLRSPAGGLAVLVELPPGSSDEHAIIADATSCGLRLVSVRDCWSLGAAPDLLAVGFAAPPDHSFREAFERLADLLARHTPS